MSSPKPKHKDTQAAAVAAPAARAALLSQVDAVHEHSTVVDDGEHRRDRGLVREIEGRGGDADTGEIFDPLEPDRGGNRDGKVEAQPREETSASGRSVHHDPDQVRWQRRINSLQGMGANSSGDRAAAIRLRIAAVSPDVAAALGDTAAARMSGGSRLASDRPAAEVLKWAKIRK